MSIKKDNDQRAFNLRPLKNVPRFLRLVWIVSPFHFASNVVLRLVQALLPLAMLWVGKEIIDEVIAITNNSGDTTRLWWLVGIELALALCNETMSRVIRISETLLGNLYGNSSSIEIIQKAARLPLPMLEDSEFYDKLERARRQTTRRVTLLSNVFAQGQDLITVTSLLLGLLVFEPWLVVLLFASVIPSFINELRFSNEKYSLLRSWTPERRELDYYRFIGASDVTAKEIKLFGLADFIADRFASLADKYYHLDKSLTIRRGIYGTLFYAIGTLAYYGAYVVILLQTIALTITVGELTFLSGSFARLRSRVQGMFSRFTSITESALYLDDYFSFIDLQIAEDKRDDYLPIFETVRTSITFTDVTFRYPGSTTPVLNGVSFTIRAGEKMAFVGENGAGKTTLIKLLLRLYEPTQGAILVDGVDVRQYRLEEYYQKFGAIFQDYVRYYLAARDNIAVGEISKIEHIDDIKSAAISSLANRVIETLPAQYNQVLGKRFKAGMDLSGGQWQKIALARAYLSDSQVIILDEPTSALDAKAEHEVFERFIALTQGRTSIIISHRFSTVRMADRILVLEGGKVLELGTHDQLMAENGLYAELFTLQAEGYQ